MGSLLRPRTYLVGSTQLERAGLTSYLMDTKQSDFNESIDAALNSGVHDGEILASTGAKICYKSLVKGHNTNITRTRDIPDNLRGSVQHGHSSIWGHVVCNFITTDCSRLFTHELIRHEVGTDIDVPPLDGLHEWSQTSGRYVRLDQVSIAFDPILEGCEDLATDFLEKTEDMVYLLECRKGLRKPPPDLPAGDPVPLPETYIALRDEGNDYAAKYKWVPNDDLPFDRKKKLTSAIRRFAPNGQVNEIFWSINLRAARHMIQVRTGRHAEWEIRVVFGDVFALLKARFPIAFEDARVEIIDGLPEVAGMRTQPYGPPYVRASS